VSGIVGIFNLDGAPIDRNLLDRLTNSLAFRGPDAQRTWFRGQIGFGHTLLRTDLDSTGQPQPFTLDNNSWIVADARVDARPELLAALRSHDQACSDETTDAELILRSYHVWGENCVDHLIGDFAFAVWNARLRRLFCARDHMGVKPFFYAHLGPLLVFSNTLECIRLHPAVSSRLNDSSIADFLLLDMIQNPEATSFADVRRLPPAHCMLCEPRKRAVRRYWTPSVTAPIQYRRPAEYLEHFRSLLDTAVADRLRTPSACVFMSGGLDSPTVAASAKRISNQNGGSPRVWAYTQVFDSLIPHDERHYAGLVARALKIPIEYRPDDNLRLFQFAEEPEYRLPEPMHRAWPDATPDHLRRVAQESRVVLTGFGADPLFSSRITVHFRQLIREKRYGRALADAVQYLSREGRLSRLYLRTRLRLLLATKETHTGFFPEWLNPDFAAKLGLRERWEQGAQMGAAGPAVRPEAHEVTFAPFWANLFEMHDAGFTRAPVEVRHPFFDLRLMNFLLALPRLPWCCDKQLLREAARNVLPDAVRVRRKSPLRSDPMLKLLARPDAAWVDRFQPMPELEPYVVRNRVPRVHGSTGPWTGWVHLRPLSLNYWLRGLTSSVINDEGGADHGLKLTAAGHSEESVSKAQEETVSKAQPESVR
jgi:asparagine synthase (glutamine-hydrolysing)